MNIENISNIEKLTLKPLPKPILYCTICKITLYHIKTKRGIL